MFHKTMTLSSFNIAFAVLLLTAKQIRNANVENENINVDVNTNRESKNTK